VWIGVNDVGNTFWGSNTEQLYEKVMAQYFAQVQTLYDAGVRKFALLEVPPIGRTPSLVAQGQSATSQATKAIALYNSLLSHRLEDFKAAHSDVKTWLIDTSVPFDKALDAPTQYGAPDATCYNGNGNSCLWFNDYHPGVAIQKLVAEEVATTVGMPFFRA
jgi:phospholipase/lecithinase/hemolysin